MSTEDVREKIEAILRDQLRISVPTPETDLRDSGLLDSLGLVDLIAAMERTFAIVIDLVELDLDDVRTVDSLTRLVETRRG